MIARAKLLRGWLLSIVMVVVPHVVSVLLNGLALWILWAWFVVTTFYGASTLSIPQAMGLSIMTHLVLRESKFNDAKGDKTPMEVMADLWSRLILRPVLAVGLGWVVKQFM